MDILSAIRGGLNFGMIAIGLALHAVSPVVAQVEIVDSAKAGPDFLVQGEYLGSVSAGTGGSVPLGAQVVAEGDGNFHIVFYPGGLPGAGWTGAGRVEVPAMTNGPQTEFRADEYAGAIHADTLSGTTGIGEAFQLLKTARVSPSLGLAPPPQATVLIGDTSLAEWDNGSITDRGYFNPLWPEAKTRKEFSNFSLHMEFQLPFLPAVLGQDRANSGLRFITPANKFAEIQILDSFGKIPFQDEGGGIEVGFNPLLPAGFPPLAWQTYDIHLTTPVLPDSGAKTGEGIMTVWFNGILIHDGVKLVLVPAAAGLDLQKRNDSISFRNMWVLSGNDHYPFFPGAAIRPARRDMPKRFGYRLDLERLGRDRSRSIRFATPKGAVLSNGRSD